MNLLGKEEVGRQIKIKPQDQTSRAVAGAWLTSHTLTWLRKGEGGGQEAAGVVTS